MCIIDTNECESDILYRGRSLKIIKMSERRRGGGGGADQICLLCAHN